MKNLLHDKSVWFYGAAITFVTLLFRITSIYGEAHLKAPPNINGRYLSTQVLPGCPAVKRLVLVIEQSGIYLNGTVFLVDEHQAMLEASQPAAAKGTRESRPFLSGLLNAQQQIELVGTTANLADCKLTQEGSNPLNKSPIPVRVQGKIDGAANLVFTGALTLGSASQVLEIQAEREVASPQPQRH